MLAGIVEHFQTGLHSTGHCEFDGQNREVEGLLDVVVMVEVVVVVVVVVVVGVVVVVVGVVVEVVVVVVVIT